MDIKELTSEELKKLLDLHERWLADEPDGVRLDLHDQLVKFCGLSLVGANLESADLSNCDLTGVDLRGAKLFRAQLVNTNLTNAKLQGTQFPCADLKGALLTKANLYNASFLGASLIGADLSYINGTWISMYDAKLNHANLMNAQLSKANMSHASLENAYCVGTEFDYATLDFTNFKNANLLHASLFSATLCNADLTGAVLQDANFSEANLSGTKLDEQEQIRFGKILTEDMIGYKVCKKTPDEDSPKVIVTLLIPAGATVFSINNKGCRTNKVKVLEIDDGAIGYSIYNNTFTYTAGQEIEVKDFNLQYNLDYKTGIHFFRTVSEAVNSELYDENELFWQWRNWYIEHNIG